MCITTHAMDTFRPSGALFLGVPRFYTPIAPLVLKSFLCAFSGHLSPSGAAFFTNQIARRSGRACETRRTTLYEN